MLAINYVTPDVPGFIRIRAYLNKKMPGVHPRAKGF